jgi:hypothetical protein
VTVLVPDSFLSAETIREQALTPARSGWNRDGGGGRECSSLLVQTMEDELGVEVQGVSRNCWDKQAGK